MNRGKHEDHPGFDSRGCELIIKINAHHMGLSSNGYACSYTGGHCLPCDACASRIDDPMIKMMKECEAKAEENRLRDIDRQFMESMINSPC